MSNSITREEILLNSIANEQNSNLSPITREEQYLSYIAGETNSFPSKPITRKEMLLDKIAKNGISGGGGLPDGYIKPEGTKQITENDEYDVTTYAKVNVDVKSEGVDKIQRWIELQGNTAQNLFRNFTGTSVDELMDGVDTSNVTGFNYMFRDCKQITTVPFFDTSNSIHFNSMFEGCSALITIPLFNGKKVTSYSCMFMDCSSLTTVPALDTRASINLASTFSGCKALTECWLRNIKTNLQVGNGTSYGHLLTVESLLSLCKECRKTTSSLKLTIGTANLTKLEGIYVKFIDITDEMRAEDDLIDEKYPFVQCESTDEGAMTMQDYMATKKWSLA